MAEVTDNLDRWNIEVRHAAGLQITMETVDGERTADELIAQLERAPSRPPATTIFKVRAA